MIGKIVNILNTPVVKESTKSAIGVTTFTLGIIFLCDEAQNSYRLFKGNRVKKLTPETLSLEKILEIATKFSIVISMLTSRPGLIVCDWTAKRMATEDQLLSFFGPNLNFEKTPYHIRHQANILGFILGIPAVLQIAYKGYILLRSKYTNEKPKEFRHLTGTQRQVMASWNTVTSRTALHGMNFLARRVL